MTASTPTVGVHPPTHPVTFARCCGFDSIPSGAPPTLPRPQQVVRHVLFGVPRPCPIAWAERDRLLSVCVRITLQGSRFVHCLRIAFVLIHASMPPRTAVDTWGVSAGAGGWCPPEGRGGGGTRAAPPLPCALAAIGQLARSSIPDFVGSSAGVALTGSCVCRGVGGYLPAFLGVS